LEWQQYTRLTPPTLVVSLQMTNTKPFVAAAFICERIMEEKDSVLSAIRIIDTYQTKLVNVQGDAGGPVVPTAANTLDLAGQHLEMSALIMLRAGAVSGQHKLSLVMRNPDGKEKEMGQFPVNFALNDPVEAAQIKARFVMAGDNPSGLYWIDVVWDGEALTSIPIRLLRTPIEDSKQ
jgi:hypothetical protein